MHGSNSAVHPRSVGSSGSKMAIMGEGERAGGEKRGREGERESRERERGRVEGE